MQRMSGKTTWPMCRSWVSEIERYLSIIKYDFKLILLILVAKSIKRFNTKPNPEKAKYQCSVETR